MARHKHNWPKLLAEFRASGQTAPKFCESVGVNVGTFRSHLYKARPPKAPEATGAFEQYVVSAELSVNIDATGGICIRGVDPEILPIVVRAWTNAISPTA